MKLSWSHKLFLKINEQVGRRPWLDRFMIFCAKWLIWVLAVEFILWMDLLVLTMGKIVFVFCFISFFCSFAIGYAIAFFWKHERPIKEFPAIRELVHPLGFWKSFPSDHTMIVTLFLGIEWLSLMSLESFVLFGVSGAVLFGVNLVASLLVMAGRVYVGVHYPRDIVGGVLVAAGSVLIFLFILLYTTSLLLD